MGIRFRRSIKIAPGFKLNINKNSIGVSAGVKGAHTSINSKGRKTTSIGIPGTGLSYVSTSNKKKNSSGESSINGSNDSDRTYSQGQTRVKSPVPFYAVGIILSLIGIIFLPVNPIFGIIALVIGVYIIIAGRKRSKMIHAQREEIIRE